MSPHGRFRSAATERGIPEDEVEKFARYLRFGIWTGKGPDGVLAGQLGGRPPLAAASPALPFVASFDCAALPEVDDLALPADGSLFFFLDRVPSEWVPLAQFKPDAVQLGRFLIRWEDLTAGRFDEVVCFTEFLEQAAGGQLTAWSGARGRRRPGAGAWRGRPRRR